MGKAIIIGILITVFVDILLVVGIVIVWLMICFNLGKMTICGDFALALACTIQFLILFLYIMMIVTFLTGRELLYCANLRQVCLNHTHE